MKFTHFFIDHPIFASVISVFMTIVGAVAYFSLPVAQYPEIAPPTIQISASYPGASAGVVSATVSTPLEQQINGVQDMLYMNSQATGDGKLTITVTFKLGTNLDTAQVLTQNRIATAIPRLPDQVQRLGVTVKKASPDLMMIVHLYSPGDTRDQLYLSNYATLQVKDVLARLPGVGDINIVGVRDYAMRVWLDPEKVAARGMTAGEVVSAMQAENVQVSSGVLNQPPVQSPGAFQLSVETLGRLSTPEQFGDIVVRTDPAGRITRVRDIARVELAAQDYTANGYLDTRVAVPMLIFQQEGAVSALLDAVGSDLRELCSVAGQLLADTRRPDRRAGRRPLPPWPGRAHRVHGGGQGRRRRSRRRAGAGPFRSRHRAGAGAGDQCAGRGAALARAGGVRRLGSRCCGCRRAGHAALEGGPGPSSGARLAPGLGLCGPARGRGGRRGRQGGRRRPPSTPSSGCCCRSSGPGRRPADRRSGGECRRTPGHR